jgi:hypothetical protein
MGSATGRKTDPGSLKPRKGTVSQQILTPEEGSSLTKRMLPLLDDLAWLAAELWVAGKIAALDDSEPDDGAD